MIRSCAAAFALWAILAAAAGWAAESAAPKELRPASAAAQAVSPPAAPWETSMEWNAISTSTLASRQSAPPPGALRYPAPPGSRLATLELQAYPLVHAAPRAALEGFRAALTRGAGRAWYDEATASLMVMDTPEIHERLWRFFKELDTPVPARMIAAPAGLIGAVADRARLALSDKGEAIVFQKEGVLILRDPDEARLTAAADTLRRMRASLGGAARDAPGGPLTEPPSLGRIPQPEPPPLPEAPEATGGSADRETQPEG